MDSSAYAFAHGVQHTRATLRSWQRQPGRVVGRWVAGSALAAAGLLAAVWVIATLDTGYTQIVQLQPPFAVGDDGDVLHVLRSNMLVLALHAMACVAGFIAGSVAAAAGRAPPRRLALAARARRADRDRLRRRRDDLLAQRPGLPDRPHAGRRLELPAASRRALLLLGVLPHAIPELIALFLPLAAWIIASRRGEWEQLLAATLVTVAIAVPVLVARGLRRGLRLPAPVHRR